MVFQSILVDDDGISRRIMESYVRQHPDLNLIGQFERPTDALQCLMETHIDVIFLDIEMPEMSGLDLIRTLDAPPKIILTSGNDKYAAEAFDLGVIDYLVKPVALPRFYKAIQRLQRSRHRTIASAAESTVFVKVEGRLIKLDLNTIQWIQAKGDYVLIRTDKKEFLAHATLKSILSKLPNPPFVRVHRSYIIHLDHIDDIEESTLVVGQAVIPIGASYKKHFLARLHLL